MNIHFAKPEHATAVAALHAASWNATYSSVLSQSYLREVVPAERKAVWQERFARPKENQFVLVAEEDGDVVGFACAFIGEHPELGSYLDNLHVRQSHQGQGLGACLLVEVAAICERSRPGLGLYLMVNQDNHRAQRFYLGFGAHNAEASVWHAPDGSHVPTFRFVWSLAAPLAGTLLTRRPTGPLVR